MFLTFLASSHPCPCTNRPPPPMAQTGCSMIWHILADGSAPPSPPSTRPWQLAAWKPPCIHQLRRLIGTSWSNRHTRAQVTAHEVPSCSVPSCVGLLEANLAHARRCLGSTWFRGSHKDTTQPTLCYNPREDVGGIRRRVTGRTGPQAGRIYTVLQVIAESMNTEKFDRDGSLDHLQVWWLCKRVQQAALLHGLFLSVFAWVGPRRGFACALFCHHCFSHFISHCCQK